MVPAGSQKETFSEGSWKGLGNVIFNGTVGWWNGLGLVSDWSRKGKYEIEYWSSVVLARHLMCFDPDSVFFFHDTSSFQS